MRIYTRSEWGARYRDGVGTRPVGALETYLHHTVTAQLPATATFEQEAVQMRSVEGIGQSRFGAGISYTFLIFPSGRIFQGASVHRISYHSGGSRNTRGAGIALVGNNDRYAVTQQQRAALRDLLAHGVEQGWWKSTALTAGHRDFKATACPGRYGYPLVAESRKPAPVATPKPAPATGKPYPDVPLVVDGHFGPVSVHALQVLMAAIGRYKGLIDGQLGPLTVRAVQEWLRWLGHYRGYVDGHFGPLTVRALQTFLRGKGLYKGLIDGSRGPLTNRAWQTYLNDQRRYL